MSALYTWGKYHEPIKSFIILIQETFKHFGDRWLCSCTINFVIAYGLYDEGKGKHQKYTLSYSKS